MRGRYEKPTIEIEMFQLNEGIAACETKVTFGPDEPDTCDDYGFGGDDIMMFGMVLDEKIEPFYDNGGCYCYTTAPKDSGYFGKS